MEASDPEPEDAVVPRPIGNKDLVGSGIRGWYLLAHLLNCFGADFRNRGFNMRIRAVAFGAALFVVGPAFAQSTSYQTIGNTIYGSNGTSYQQIGNTTYGSNGTSYQRIGNTTYDNNGNSYQRIGNTTYGSNGNTTQTIGNTTYINGPNGSRTCQQIGNMLYCN